MSDIIKLLPDHISNQIAAGEVIQRPSSVLKELIENSLDAKASKIKVILKDSGKSLIQIIDNGIGMSITDARLCFEKHATSKINDVNDLFKIRSNGFRGEALASIAAVAQVELKTKREIDDIGTKIEIEGSKILSQNPTVIENGTQFLVKNLFFNIPARRNFLKTDNEELRHLVIEFERLALAYNDIGFELYHNDKEIYKLIGESLHLRIINILGPKTKDKIVKISEQTDYLNISGYLSKPEFSNNKNRQKQYIFVNKRFIKSNYISHSIISAYQNILKEKEQPFFVVFLDIDPQKIDVNVSPTKQEIKFEDERIIYQFINAVVRKSLTQNNLFPTIDFSLDKELNNFQAMITPIDRSKVIANNNSSIKINRPLLSSPNQGNWEQFYLNSLEEQDQDQEITKQSKLNLNNIQNNYETIPIQLINKYILVQSSNALLFVDAKRAHQRVIYDKLYLNNVNTISPIQKLLFPIVLDLSAQDSFVFLEIYEDLKSLGFDIAQLGKNNIAIQGIPPDLTLGNEKDFILELIEDFKMTYKAKSNKRESLLISISNISSIKKNQTLEEMEIKMLIDNLFDSENFYFTPNGKKIIFTFENTDLISHFN